MQMAQPKQKRVVDATAALQLAQRNLAYKQASLNKVEIVRVCVIQFQHLCRLLRYKFF